MSSRDNVLIPQKQKKTEGFVDPYYINIHSVKPFHFRDARIYDPEIKESGWQISARSAQKKYRNWLTNVRSRDGFYLFRRIIYEPRDISTNDNDSVVFRSHNNNNNMMAVMRNTSPNSHKTILSSRNYGMLPDDNEFIPKMFTEKMGREISSLRNQKNMTQTELARILNIDSGIIRNIELGGMVHFNPNDAMVISLARALGVASIKYCE